MQEHWLGHYDRTPAFAPALWGRDADGTPFFDDSLPWISREVDADGKRFVVIDTEIARRLGIEVFRDPSTEKVVEVAGD